MMHPVVTALGAAGAILTVLGVISFVVGIWTEEADQFTRFFLGVGLFFYGIWALCQGATYYFFIGAIDLVIGGANFYAFVKNLRS
jgi:hypothetical protein